MRMLLIRNSNTLTHDPQLSFKQRRLAAAATLNAETPAFNSYKLQQVQLY